jgi:Fic family protein
MTEKDELDKMNRKLDSIQRDVNDIQGDVRMQAKLHKDLNREELKNQIYNSFGGSTAKRKIWYYANGERTASEIAELANVAFATASRNATKLAESGVLDRLKEGNTTYYQRAEITKGLGIARDLENDLDL